MRRWRNGPDRERIRATKRAMDMARSQALSALARRHPAEYRALYEAELAYAGIELRPPGRPAKPRPLPDRR